MATGDFDLYYPSQPWANITTNQRHFYAAGLLRDYFLRNNVYSGFVTAQFRLDDVNAESMTVTRLIEPHANFNSVAHRNIWMPASYSDSEARRIAVSTIQAKVALHEYDEAITYWRNGDGRGLRSIINGQLGPMFTKIMDTRARNAFLTNPLKMIGDASLTGFDQVGSSHTLSTLLVEQIQLQMQLRGVPFGAGVACITSPSVIHSMKQLTAANEWLDVMKYAAPGVVANGTFTQWKGITFIPTNDAILYNCGVIGKQVNVTGQITAGDGAIDPAVAATDGARYVGQSGVARTHYVQCSAFADAEFKAGDLVTVHVNRTNANGVTNGVDYTDGKAEHRRVVSVDHANDRLTFDRPILEDFKTDLGGGVYGYVTKARHIHTALFLGSVDGVVLGVIKEPTFKTPAPVDDAEAIYRFTVDAKIGHNLFEPEAFNVWYGAAPYGLVGQVAA